MINQKIGIEINGGGRNTISNANISIESSGQAIVINNSIDNQLTNITISFKEELRIFDELASLVNDISDNSVNKKTQKTFKEDISFQIQTILTLPNKELFQANTLALIALLSDWITIKSGLAASISPFFSQLLSLI